MTRRALAVTLFASLSALPRLAAAQEVRQQGKTIAFPAFTLDQNWSRASTLLYAAQIGAFAYAKQHGASADAYGREVSRVYAPGWGQPESGSAIRYARGIQNNLRAFQGSSVDVLQVNDTLVTMRVLRNWRSYFGPTQTANGVTLDEYDAVDAAFNAEIARHLGLHYVQRVDGDYLVMTISGRGKNAVIDFPRGTYTTTLSAQDVPGHPEDVGTWEFAYAPDGRFAVRKNGAAFLQGDYELSFDEVVWRNERQANGDVGCAGPGRFRWTANPTTGALTFGRLADDCENRVLVLTRKALTKR